MTEHFNRLTPSEAELLAILAEEAGEVVQIVSKILRHGYESYHPDDDAHTTNRHLLEREIGDFDAACVLLADAESIRRSAVKEASDRKREKLKRWTHHQPVEVP